ncbi:uncharacterized protein LOC122262286 isoform X2 [Penaeus japonicus]|uniref:uncharacterized protein LOC122262286 isoform X2 n=1 Tax=Penaeus japonicus TaxID=27405 RepID=UPI001C716C7A|nr:uncharacterized protein LOC122262286 isoform X2 [Penaeus japonicus]
MSRLPSSDPVCRRVSSRGVQCVCSIEELRGSAQGVEIWRSCGSRRRRCVAVVAKMKLACQMTSILLLASACSILANESRKTHGEGEHNRRDTSVGVQQHGRGGRDKDHAADGDTMRAWVREERRRLKEERRQDRWERREERRRQRQDGRRSGSRHDGPTEEEPGPERSAAPHQPPRARTRNEMVLAAPSQGHEAAAPPPATTGSASRHGGREAQGSPPLAESQHSQEVINMEWMRANLSSLWVVVRELSRQHARFVGQRGHTGRGRGQGFVGPVVGEGHPSCPVSDDDCRMDGSQVCGGHGDCSCGHCLCYPGYYGTYCQCSDHTCPLYDGMKCGGPSRGQCRCGGCVCRPGYTGEACDCPTDTLGCIGSVNGTICSDQGTCQCGRCRCDDGYKGMYCEDTVYAAGVCEKLKPCVLCKAWNRELLVCADCQITITMVDNLEPAKNTCVMVNSGCLLKYSYIPQGPDAYTVLVPRDMQCPPKSEEE